MKQKITLIVFLFITFFCHSQKCVSDEFLNIQKNNNPQLDAKIKEVIKSFKKNDVSNTGKTASTQELISEEIVVIPVVFNVIHSGEPLGVGKNISLNKIEEQISLLNQAYSGQYGGVDTKIRFCLAKQNTIGQATTGVNRFIGNASYDMGIPTSFNLFCVPNTETDWQIKRNISSGFPSNFFLNIWTTDLKYCGKDSLLGFSSFPFDNNPTLDGVVLDYLQVGINGAPNTSNYSNGTTAVHEIGHWLGLFHIFSDEGCDETDCENEGDLICDTDAVPTSGDTNIVSGGNCLGYNCKGQTTDVVQNYMDYQISSRMYCQTKFTLGQKKRMKSILSYYRPSIYNQGMVMDLISCKSYSMSGGGGGCGEDATLPVQKIIKPTVYQDLSQLVGASVKFGQRLEVNDKWLVTIFNTTAYYPAGTPKPNGSIANSLVIYKREGCKYALHQMIDIDLSNSQQTTDFGLLLNGNEIVISSSIKDEVSICRLNESSDKWEIVQQIQNITPTSEVGSSTYTIGRFLFILERNTSADNIFRVYHKNNSEIYVFHQNIAVSGFSMPTYGKLLQSGNFKTGIVNFNSGTFIGSYDPPEILVSRYKGSGFVMFELNSNNMWVVANTMQPAGMPSTERISDIEASKDFIYVLTSAQTGPQGSLDDILYLYSYRITPNSSNPFQSSYSKQALISSTDAIYGDIKLQIFNDQFLFVDNTKFQPLSLFYNSNSGSINFPIWQKKGSKKITCSNTAGDPDDFEVFGNLLFYGYGESLIQIYNMSDILSREGYDQTFIDDSDFYDKKINLVPDNYTTSAQKITVAESGPIEFNYIEKEFVASERIILKPGTRISSGSTVKLKISDSFSLCNSIVTSKKSDNESDIINDYLSEAEDEKFYKTKEKVILYPNPNSGVFIVHIGKEHNKPISCNIYNSTGQLMYQTITEKSTIEINLPNLAAGNYIVKLKGDNFNEAIKFIKQ